MGLGSQTYRVHFFKLYEMIEEFETTVRQSAELCSFYEYEDNIDQTIYNEKDVDKCQNPLEV